MPAYEIGQCAGCPLRAIDPLPLTGTESCESLAMEMCQMLAWEQEEERYAENQASIDVEKCVWDDA